MRINPPQIRLNQHIGGGPGIFRGNSHLFENLKTKIKQCLFLNNGFTFLHCFSPLFIKSCFNFGISFSVLLNPTLIIALAL